MKDFKQISSKDNSLIKLISKLQTSKKCRYENGLFVLEGLRICKDALDTGTVFDKLIISKSALEKLSEDIDILSENAKECIEIPDYIFEKLSDTKSPQGILAVCKMKEINAEKIDINGRYLAFENVSDPSNLGAVARTCEALGVSGIILSNDGCDPYSPKVLRASMGTMLRMPLYILDDFAKDLAKLPLKKYACVVDKDAKSIKETEFNDGSIVIIGNEANGITDETIAVSDSKITIKMTGKAESLNAAAAAAIAIWEMMK
ncbi:MAG: RNA methyltransferase [Clostridia bacterium]|nr:RNA methyltransferase [Clostridia bacterium]